MYSSLLVKQALAKHAGPISKMLKRLLVKEMPGSYKLLPSGAAYHIGLERPTTYDFLNMAGVGSHPQAGVRKFLRSLRPMSISENPSLSQIGPRWSERLRSLQHVSPYEGPSLLRPPFTPKESLRKTLFPGYMSRFNAPDRAAIRKNIISNRALNLSNILPNAGTYTAGELAHGAENITGFFPKQETTLLPPTRSSILRRPNVKAF